MADLILYAGIFMAVMAAGLGFILWQRSKKSAKKVKVVVFQPTATGINVISGFGIEIAQNTQKMLDCQFIGRKLNYPNPSLLIKGTYFIIQTDEVTFRPLLLRVNEYPNDYVRELLERIRVFEKDGKEEELKLNKEEIKKLNEYIKADKLEPEIDKAFRITYANNVEQIVLATKTESSSLFDKLMKLMPVIVIIATALFIVLALYGFFPIFNSELSHLSSLTLTCNGAPATISSTGAISGAGGSSIIPPSP